MRPKNDDGVLLPPPHQRLQNAPALIQAGFLALAQDGRSVIWTTAQKITILNKVVDHVVDGDKIPKRFYAKDKDFPDNHALIELWRTAERGVRDAMRKAA